MTKEPDLNRDPITGTPGAHPVGAGVGAASGALAGAAVGAIAGPVGAAVGAVVAGVVGGLTGKGFAEGINPTAENAYWAENHPGQPHADPAYSYDDYGPAYQYGYTSRGTGAHRTWDEAEDSLGAGWDKAKGKSRLGWDKAKHAAKAAWNKVEDAIPGDSDRDGH